MITSMHIENFKCFKEFDIELGSFNVLIGPNDTGKTAFLQAIRLLCAHAESPDRKDAAAWLLEIAGVAKPISASWNGQPNFQMSIAARAVDISVHDGLDYSFVVYLPSGSVMGNDGTAFTVDTDLGRPEYYRLSPASLRSPSPLAQEMSETGEGFAALLDNINRNEPDALKALQADFVTRFPHYSRVEIAVVRDGPHNRLALKFHANTGQVLDSTSVSDGVMLSLAFLSLAYRSKQPVILLIEEPENGVHHASLKEIVLTLKQLSTEKGVQVIMTTHSPYLLDHVEPEEVFVFSKDEEGAVHAKKFSDHPQVETLRKHFMTGELWTGFDEKDIVEGKGKFE